MASEILITGLGVVSPAGLTAPAAWEGLLAGERYVAPAPNLDLTGCATNFCAQVRNFSPPSGTETQDRVCQLAVAAAEEAVGHANLSTVLRDKPSRVVVSVGTSKGGILTFAELAPLLTENRRRGRDAPPSRQQIASIAPNAPARCIAERFGISGGIHATVAACSTGTLAVIRAARFIEDDEADVVLAGSADASLHRLWFAAFEQMGVLAPAHPNHGPAWACRPFDANRAGLALGEGAAILVLESAQSARRRGVKPIARLSGAAAGTDPAGLTQVSQDAGPLAEIIRVACARAGCQPADIACVHAHGTGTPTNDRAETRAIRQALGNYAAEVPIVSIKGAIGHLLGGAGAVEIAMAALSCQEGRSPGTVTLLDLDPGLGRLNVPREAFGIARGPILKTSLGFGGHVAATILAPA